MCRTGKSNCRAAKMVVASITSCRTYAVRNQQSEKESDRQNLLTHPAKMVDAVQHGSCRGLDENPHAVRARWYRRAESKYGVLWEGVRKGSGGDRGTRTPNLGIANAALSQLSYIPMRYRRIIAMVRNRCQFADTCYRAAREISESNDALRSANANCPAQSAYVILLAMLSNFLR